jgi:hypothetical protein
MICLCCNKTYSKDSVHTYPPEIRKYKLEAFYDTAKWYMYCIHCDKYLDFIDTTKPKMYYGFLPLEFDTLILTKKYIEIHFYFLYNAEKVKWPLIDRSPYSGVVFSRKTGRIVKYSSHGDMRYYMPKISDISKCVAREVKPLQPAVCDFIINNKDKLDPWFLEAAKKHHVLK